jgi:hypothetical protein
MFSANLHKKRRFHFLKFHAETIFGAFEPVNLLTARNRNDTIQKDGTRVVEIQKLANKHALVFATFL